MKYILEYLEDISRRYPDKIAFADTQKAVCFQEFTNTAQAVGSGINQALSQSGKPIAIFIDRSVSCLAAMMGTLYSGNFYAVLDVKSPLDRLQKILDTLAPAAIITDKSGLANGKALTDGTDIQLLEYEALEESSVNAEALAQIRGRVIDTDPMYVLFTSGSTGVPKGVVVSHRAVIAYTTWVIETFGIDENTSWGSQTPFYFSMSITDIFSTLMSGASFYIIPKMYFSFPVTLINFLNEKKINTIYWVPSALNIVANMDTFSAVVPQYLKKILFAGEVMPTKQLNIWRQALPDAFYANLFGPTETTDICTYYVVDRDFANDEALPIGNACNNCGIIVIDEQGRELPMGQPGELCARGSFLAMGYYNNPQQTAAAFVQNPLNTAYPETVYKTGDIVRYNERGELIYMSRKDFQIKHMGYRIELGEIEAAVNNIDNIISSACIYDKDKQKIILFYQGNADEDSVLALAKSSLPIYMRPNKVFRLERMLYNANGKIDRVALTKKYKGE